MNWKKELAKLETLLAEGKTEEILEKTSWMLDAKNWLSENSTAQDKEEVWAIRGMAWYRRKEFQEARDCFELSLIDNNSNERATYGMAYLAAYVDKDPDKVREWMEKLPESAARDNAWMIIMRSPEYIGAHTLLSTEGDVQNILIRWLVPNPKDPLNTANILHNSARFYLEYGDAIEYMTDEPDDPSEKNECVFRALAYLTSAIGLYGTGNTNLHHRAAAHYWLSVAQEKILGAAAAIPFACKSLRLWYKQIRRDWDNPHYQKSYINSEEHLLSLKNQMRAQWFGNNPPKYIDDLFNEATKTLKAMPRDKRDTI